MTPESAGWRYLSFRVERLAGAEERDTGREETAIVLLEGACSVEADGERFELGPRAGVFEQLPWTLYLPRDTDVPDRGRGRARGRELPAASVRREPVLQRPDEVDVEVRGAGNATRQINNMIQPGFPAERILVGRGADAGRQLVELPAAQARRGPAARGGAARGGLLLPRAGAGGVRAAAALQPRARRRRERGPCATATCSWCRTATTRSRPRPATTSTT